LPDQGVQQTAYQYAWPVLLHHSQTSLSTVPLVVETPLMSPAPLQKPPAEMAISPALQTVFDSQVAPVYVEFTLRVTQLLTA
jgi:hypothetical protein